MLEKTTLLLFAILGLLTLQSCEECRTCQAWKDGVEDEVSNCAIGSSKTLDTWEDFLVDERGLDYDSVFCVKD